MRRLALLISGALLATPVLSGCGGNSVADYCGAMQADQNAFAQMLSINSPTSLLNNLPMMQSLADKAPADIADDWQTLLAAIQGLATALKQAGVPASAYHDGKPPAGLSTGKRKQISAAADQLSRATTQTAADNIDQEARDVCKVNLGL